jgi:hypothetical protein
VWPLTITSLTTLDFFLVYCSEVARCIRDGKVESERCNLAESRIVQSVFDEVRKQGGYLGGNAKGKAGSK